MGIRINMAFLESRPFQWVIGQTTEIIQTTVYRMLVILTVPEVTASPLSDLITFSLGFAMQQVNSFNSCFAILMPKESTWSRG